MALPPLEQLIARGGSAEVWRSGRLAVKILTAERAQDSWYRICFQREIRASAALDHPNLLEVIDYGIDERGRPWMASPFMEGGDLLAKCGRMEWERVREVLLGLLSGLAHAHAHGIVHLDVKPRNVLCGHGEWKLGDFGLAHALEWEDHKPTIRIVGTPAYMAPEHFEGAADRYGPWTDLYSLGCLAWQLVTGRPPFVGEVRVLQQAHMGWPLPKLKPAIELPMGLEAWLCRLLEKEPAARFRHAADAAYGLSRLSEERTHPVLMPAGALSSSMDTMDLVTEPIELSGELPSTTGPLPALSADAVPFREDWRGETGPRLLDPQRLGLAALRTMPLVGREEERDRLWALLRDLTEVTVVCVTGGDGSGKSHLGRWFCTRAEELGAAHTKQVGELSIEERSALRRAVEHAVVDRPVLIWIDEPTAEGARATVDLLRGVQGPVLVLITGEQLLTADHHLSLEPLDEPTMLHLVHNVLGLAGSVAAQVAERAQGNPLLAVQLAASVKPNLVSAPRGWVLPPGARLELPKGLDSVWRTRLEDFLSDRPEAHRSALELASALGPEVPYQTWRSRCTQAGITCPPEFLDELIRAGLAQERGENWRLAHPLLRHTLRQGADLPRWHALLALYARDAGERGFHLLEAGDDGAAEALLEGIRESMQASDYPRAERLLAARERAVGEDAAGLLLAARLAGVRGSPAEGSDLARRALMLADNEHLRTRALLQGARLLTRSGEVDRAGRWYAQALRGADKLNDFKLLGRVRELLGHFLVEQGRLRDGEKVLLQAALDYEAVGADEELGGVYQGLGVIALGRGDGPAAAEHGHRALRHARQVRAESKALVLLGDAHRAMARFDSAREYLERNGERAHKAGLIYDACINELNLALIDLEEGQLAEARKRVRRFSPALEARGARLLLGIVALIEAVCAAGEGRHAEIADLLDQAEENLAHTGRVNRDIAWLAEELADRAEPREAARAVALARRQREALAG